MAQFEVVVKIAYKVEAPTAKAARAIIDDKKIPEALVNAALRNSLIPYKKKTGVARLADEVTL